MTFAILMIYLAGVTASVQILSGLATLFTGGMLLLLIGASIADDFNEETVIQAKKWGKTLIIGCAISTFVLVFTPSQKTFYMLAGADVAEQVSDKANPLFNKTLELIEAKIDEELQGMERKQNGK